MAGEEKSEAMNSLNDSSGNKIGTDETPAARRARLRPSLAKQSSSNDPAAVPASDPGQPGGTSAATPGQSAPHPGKPDPDQRGRAGTGLENPSIVNVHARRGEATVESQGKKEAQGESSPMVLQGSSPGYQNDVAISPKAQALIEQSFAGVPPAQLPIAQALDNLNSIDQTMAACATNLAALERVAQEQSLALKALTETLQNQTFTEIGLNLTSLMESLTAALEPMKAAGELVPAIDDLVSAIKGADSTIGESKLTKEQLVTNLADQLSSGRIDPATFKAAYMAVYPADHPADLLNRLVELLGTQRLSGDLFRAAYEAVQADEAAPVPTKASKRRGGKAGAKAEEEVTDALPTGSEDGALNQSTEDSVTEAVETLPQEAVESEESMDAKWQEFDKRFRELEALLQDREVELQRTSMQLSAKDSENQQLRAQMEELRDQTKDLVADLQKQLTQTKDKEEPAPPAKPPSPGFFDITPGQSSNLFESNATKSLFQQEDQFASPAPSSEVRQSSDFAKPAAPQPQANLGKGPAQQFGGAQSAIQTQPNPQAPAGSGGQPQAQVRSNSPITTPMAPGPGSYGSGVRAQVFEVIVRQALAGAPWQDICSGPMQVNNISPEEVEAEVKRRQALIKK